MVATVRVQFCVNPLACALTSSLVSPLLTVSEKSNIEVEVVETAGVAVVEVPVELVAPVAPVAPVPAVDCVLVDGEICWLEVPVLLELSAALS